MSWLDLQVSLYSTHADNIGKPASIRDILFCEFQRDLPSIIKIRNLNTLDSDYKLKKAELKSSLQCYTPAALLETKKRGMVKVIEHSGILQIDFDYSSINEFDIEELKQAVFALPFIGFCGLSCSGDGFYALALIAEPEKLSQYAEHIFAVLESYGLKPDTSKGRNVNDLRYLSYDSKMLVRENPVPLKVTCFKRREVAKKEFAKVISINAQHPNKLVMSELKTLGAAIVGQRWQTVQQVAYTLGGLGDGSLLHLINQEIIANKEFAGQEEKYLTCAKHCFDEGMKKPLKVS